MQLLRSLLVRVCLNTQGFVDRENLEEEGKVSLRGREFVGNLTSDEVWIRSQNVREAQARADYP